MKSAMMTPSQRAKQFIHPHPLAGLREALIDREERHSREEMLIPDEEKTVRLNGTLAKLRKGQKVAVGCYSAFHNINKTGNITYISFPSRFFLLDRQKIFFNDIYSLEIIDF